LLQHSITADSVSVCVLCVGVEAQLFLQLLQHSITADSVSVCVCCV